MITCRCSSDKYNITYSTCDDCKKKATQKVAKGVGVKYDAHSTQINLYDNTSEKDFGFAQTQRLIKPDEIYREFPQVPARLGSLKDDPRESYGLETTPHVTLLFGLLNDLDYFPIRQLVGGFEPFDLTVGEISSFRNPEKPYDVLKMTVVSPKLVELHDIIKSKFKNKESFPDYKPHLTLAYVKKGACKEIEGKCAWTGTSYKIRMIKFSHSDGYKLEMPVGGSVVLAKIKKMEAKLASDKAIQREVSNGITWIRKLNSEIESNRNVLELYDIDHDVEMLQGMLSKVDSLLVGIEKKLD